MAALAGPLAGIAGSIFGGLFGAHASNNAANQYIDYLQQAQGLIAGQEQKGLANFQPYISGGTGAANILSNLLGTQGQGLLTPWNQTFTAPTAAQAEATPGYQFQLQQGLNAAQNSAAGQGSLLSGRTLAGLNNYAQGQASTNYQNVFNNSLTQYQSAYNTFLNNQQSQYSMLSGLSGEGLQAAGGAGQMMENMGGDQASLLAQMGAVRAGGTLGAANAYESILPGIASQSTPGNGLTPQYAEGTDFAPGGPSLVGERGPELVNLPTGAQVVPNNRLSTLGALAGGGGFGGSPISTPMPYRPVGPPQGWGGQPPVANPMPFRGGMMPLQSLGGATA